MILISGFEPFGGAERNPSAEAAQEAARALRAQGEPAHAVVLPCSFGVATRVLREAMAEYRPEAVIATGVAGGRARISLERVAVNLIDARIPDNAGSQPLDQPCVPDAPNAYFTRLPVKRVREQLEAAGLPGEVSYTAGTYVCNDTFYGLMHSLAGRPDTPAGFIHVPELGASFPDNSETWSVQAMARGLVIAALAALDTARRPGPDLDVSAGTES